MSLSPNHKIFCEEWVKDRNGRRAAIAAKYAEKSADVTASRLLRNAKVKAYIDELLKEAQKRRQETLDDILNELDENRKAALSAETVQSAAATAATMAKAKLLGFSVDKSEVKHSGELTHSLQPAPKLSKDEWLKSHGLSPDK